MEIFQVAYKLSDVRTPSISLSMTYPGLALPSEISSMLHVRILYLTLTLLSYSGFEFAGML